MAITLICFPAGAVRPFQLNLAYPRLDNGMCRKLDSWPAVESDIYLDLAIGGTTVEASDDLENGVNRAGPFPRADSLK